MIFCPPVCTVEAIEMTLNVSIATELDAERIANVHMAAFGANAMLCAQFPTPASRDKLRRCIAQKAVDDMRDPYVAVVVVRDQTEIISFAKWSLPVLEAETYEESPWIWPNDTDFAVLNKWTEKVESAKQKTLGNAPCYREYPTASLAICPFLRSREHIKTCKKSRYTQNQLLCRKSYILINGHSVYVIGSSL